MELLEKNPFTTIKANDLDDSEINDQWVDIQNNGLLELFAPKQYMSQYILGGKGSGKTHLMRYFSYKSQLLRNKAAPIDLLTKDGYFGIYFQASGLNGSRFEHLPLNAPARNAIFEYSFELWFAGLVLEALEELTLIDDNLFHDEAALCEDIKSLFIRDVEGLADAHTVSSLKSEIVKLSNKVDFEVNNFFFKEKFDVEILTNKGSLIFGIPKLLTLHSHVFEKVSFLYLIDELENISESQQVYLNSLLREKKLPVSFRLGARRHGVKSWNTLGAGEANRKDNEFEIINLDYVFSEKDYETFATNLIINRLVAAGFIHKEMLPNGNSNVNHEQRKEFLTSLFEQSDIAALITSNARKKSSELSPIIKSFSSRVKIIKGFSNITDFLNNLSYPKDLRLEKAAIHIVCQMWKNNSNSTVHELLKFSEEVKAGIDSFVNNNSDSNNPIDKKLGHFSNNYTASALRATSQNNFDQYTGFQQLLSVTKGFPRHILTVLRHAYKIEVFQGNTPFLNGNKLSLKAQKFALKESADWFHEDCISEGKLGTQVGIALDRLCEIFRLEMYADKPVECSASSFTVDSSKLSDYSRSVLEWAEMIRVIIPAERQRQEKNSQKLVNKYHLNGLLCPKWGLSLSRRGAISFKTEDFEKILKPDLENEYNYLKQSFEESRYAPFNIVSDKDSDKLKEKASDTEQNNDKQLGWNM
ncbi:ORC-CDC6 family AAA ATPase [Alteromonas macleodii]|uniref:ORC-CDC6 family AAA ATPase n=1 Tax=Alteromonas macleodii TaxID=28108 RepID=UPI0010036393|nr:hypothetical protein [Alteromonas macleodii]RUM31602.1 MAG: hypothetical protein DSY75_03275 [Alteromonas sp.]CAI2390228.1 hypothetical protein ALT831_02199 [Alteromonas macleodii]CAI3958065.1 hypothetical protein ALTBGP9_02129 [Alteromonas macleodii]CAI3959082.1 hypothetical protein ALTBGP14_02199 [Alteromonas macleodii]CAI3959091.1 hypothetical protein ALTBGP6_02199 [Alteromonas macleodii]|tara:strand:- start:1985 stop:4081 length:2097 start_codon:yes stop_codon:yes gene_type:complete